MYPCLQSTVWTLVFSFPPRAVWTWVHGSIPFNCMHCGSAGCIPFPPHAVWICRVYPISTTCSVDLQGVSHFHRMQFGSAGCIPFPPHAVWICRVYPFSTASTVDVRGISLYIACSVPECRTVSHPENPVPE